tara:strand:- start:3442 stop:3858 length:417 start_codon:yes stop_codon:yes gene_type:complete
MHHILNKICLESIYYFNPENKYEYDLINSVNMDIIKQYYKESIKCHNNNYILAGHVVNKNCELSLEFLELLKDAHIKRESNSVFNSDLMSVLSCINQLKNMEKIVKIFMKIKSIRIKKELKKTILNDDIIEYCINYVK